MDSAEINVGVLVVHSPAGDPAGIRSFAERLTGDVAGELERASGAAWRLHLTEARRLADDEPRRPADFLDEASRLMAEGPFDAVVVLTDVGLVSRQQRAVAGLSSPVGQIAVVSLRKLLSTPRGHPVRTLESESVRWNAAALVLHLIGHMLGLTHAPADPVMAPFSFDEDRLGVPEFGSPAALHRRAARIVDEEHHIAGWLPRLGFHLLAAARHPARVLRPLLRNQALLLPLALPGLATAAVLPTLVLVYTAEIWDAGLNMDNRVAWAFAAVSVLAAACYLVLVQNLFLPSKDKRVVTEHLALVNVSIFLSLLLATVGLFLMLGALMLTLELLVFPEGLIATWPTLDRPVVTLWDKIRLAGFISTIGVLTGALAGGLENRNVIRHLALFLDEP